MAESKLTPFRRELLSAANRNTHHDDSGRGQRIHDGHDLRAFERLREAGFVTITLPHSGGHLGFARITPAGRAALRQQGGSEQ